MIKSYRIHKGITQEELAKNVGCDVRTIQRIENGANYPSIKIFKKIINELNIKDKDIINYIKK